MLDWTSKKKNNTWWKPCPILFVLVIVKFPACVKGEFHSLEHRREICIVENDVTHLVKQYR